MRFILPFQWHQHFFVDCDFMFTIFFIFSSPTDTISFLKSKLTASMRKFCMLAPTNTMQTIRHIWQIYLPSSLSSLSRCLFFSQCVTSSTKQRSKHEAFFSSNEHKKKVKPKKFVWKKFLSRVVRLTLRCGCTTTESFR